MLNRIKYFKYYSKLLIQNWRETKSTYSQHGEDLLIELLLPKGVSTFIDIGANDGVLFSNSFKFAKQGAQGICIEPSKDSYRKLKLNHLFHRKVECIQAAISDTNGFLFLQEQGYEATLSEVSKERTENAYKVSCFTLDRILNLHPKFLKVDLLTVDVEGHEEEVFRGLSKIDFIAKLIILESDKTQIDNLLSIPSLRKYRATYTNGLNTILSHESQTLPIDKKLPVGFKNVRS